MTKEEIENSVEILKNSVNVALEYLTKLKERNMEERKSWLDAQKCQRCNDDRFQNDEIKLAGDVYARLCQKCKNLWTDLCIRSESLFSRCMLEEQLREWYIRHGTQEDVVASAQKCLLWKQQLSVLAHVFVREPDYDKVKAIQVTMLQEADDEKKLPKEEPYRDQASDWEKGLK